MPDGKPNIATLVCDRRGILLPVECVIHNHLLVIVSNGGKLVILPTEVYDSEKQGLPATW